MPQKEVFLTSLFKQFDDEEEEGLEQNKQLNALYARFGINRDNLFTIRNNPDKVNVRNVGSGILIMMYFMEGALKRKLTTFEYLRSFSWYKSVLDTTSEPLKTEKK